MIDEFFPGSLKVPVHNILPALMAGGAALQAGTSILGGILGKSAAKDAAEKQRQAAIRAENKYDDYWTKMYDDFLPFLESSEMMLPFIEDAMARDSAVNQKLLDELGVAYQGTKPTTDRSKASQITPGMQDQLSAFEQFKKSGIDAKEAPGFIGGQLGWQTWDDKERFIAENKDALESLLPPGMSVKDVPRWEQWITNPVPIDSGGNPIVDRSGRPIDKYGNVIDTSAPEQGATTGTGTTAEGPDTMQPSGGFEKLVKEGPGKYEDSDYYKDMQKSMDYAIERANREMGTASTASGAGYGRKLVDYAVPMADEAYRQGRGNFLNEWVQTKYNPYQNYINTLIGGTEMPQLPQMNLVNTMANAGNQYVQGASDSIMNQGTAEASGILGGNQATQNMLGGISSAIGTGLSGLNSMVSGGGVNFLGGGSSGGGGGSGSFSPIDPSNNYGLGSFDEWMNPLLV